MNKTMLILFIGMSKYSWRYIPQCGTICDVLNSQLRDDADGIWTVHGDWTADHQEAMNNL